MRRRPRSADWRRGEERRVSLSRMRTYDALLRLESRHAPRSRRERSQAQLASKTMTPTGLLSSIAVAEAKAREFQLTFPRHTVGAGRLAPLRSNRKKRSNGRRDERAAARRAEEQMRQMQQQREAKYKPSDSVMKCLEEAPQGSLPTTVDDALKGTTTTMQNLLSIFDQLVQDPGTHEDARANSGATEVDGDAGSNADGEREGAFAGPRQFLENVFCNAFILENLLQEIVPKMDAPQTRRFSDNAGEVARVISALRNQVRRLCEENSQLRKQCSDVKAKAHEPKDGSEQSSLTLQLEEELRLQKALIEAADAEKREIKLELAQAKHELKLVLNAANGNGERERAFQETLKSITEKASAAEEHANSLAQEIERERVERMIGSCNHKSTQFSTAVTESPAENNPIESESDCVSEHDDEHVQLGDGNDLVVADHEVDNTNTIKVKRKRARKKRKKKVPPPFKGKKWEESAIFWCRNIKNGRGLLHFAQNYRLNDIPDVPPRRLLSTIGEIVMDKIQADKVDDDAGNKRDTMAEFCEEWHLHKYGLLSMAARECGKLLAAIRRNRNEHPRFELFGRLVGVFRPLEDEACNFILHAWSIMEPCTELVADEKAKTSELWMSHSRCLQLFPRIFIRPDSARQTSDGKPYTFELPASQLTRLGRRIRKLEQEAETRGDKSTQGQIVVLGDSLLHFFLDEWRKESHRKEQRLRALFIAADVDGDGNLNLDEFRTLLQFVMDSADVGKWEACKMYERSVQCSDALADAELPLDQITAEGFSAALVTEGRIVAELARVLPTVGKDKARLRDSISRKMEDAIANSQVIALEHEGTNKSKAIHAATARLRQLMEYSDIQHLRAARIALDLLHFVAHGSRSSSAESLPNSVVNSPSGSRQASPVDAAQ